MQKQLNLLLGLGLGGAAMFFLDPVRGHARRVRARDQLGHRSREIGSALDVSARDLMHRTQGVISEIRATLIPERDNTDDVIEDRVRAKLGRYCSHPHSIEVTSDDRVVTLKGLILTRELAPLMAAVASVRGVGEIVNKLESHESHDRLPGLQGGVPRLGDHPFAPTPGTRLLTGLAGIVAMGFGLSRRGILGWMSASSGLASVALVATGSRERRTWIPFPTIDDEARGVA